MQETNKFKLGLFVSVSILLFIAAVMSMGIFDSLFKAKVHMATFVEESVQGLNTGSAVKYRGVPIGNVNDITIAMGGQTIRIDMEIDLSKFKIKRGSNFLGLSSISPQDFYKYLLDDIQKGLRCRIEPDGITGLKYVEIDFFKDIAALPAEEETPGLQNGIFYLPSTPSLMANLRISMTEILANIASINFKKISRETISLLSTANKTLSDPKLQGLMDNANQLLQKVNVTMDNLNKSVTEEKLNTMIKDINQAVNSIRDLATSLEQTTKEARIPQTAGSVRELSGALTESNDGIRTTIVKLNETLDAMTELIQYLNDNPASVLHGRGTHDRKQ